MPASTRRSEKCSRRWRKGCPAGWSRWNGSWSITAAPVIPSTCPMPWRSWAMPSSRTSNTTAPRPSLRSESMKRKLNNVLRQLGLPAAADVPDEVPAIPEDHLRAEIPKAPTPKLRSDVSGFGAEIADRAPASAAPLDPQLDEETQRFIAQSLTDVDLFASYGLTQKAIGLLEAILRRAPRHTPTLEKLLDFVLGAGDDRRTAELAAQLAEIHGKTGDKRSSERFGELRRRFQRAAGLTDEELASARPAVRPTDVSLPEIPAEPVPTSAVEQARPEPVEVNATPVEGEVQEVDLSDEWATLLEESHQGETTVEAPAAQPPGRSRPHEVPGVEEFQISAAPQTVSPNEVPATAFNAAPEDAPLTPEAIGKASDTPRPQKVPAPPASELEFELDQEFELVLDAEPLVPAYDQKPPVSPTVPAERATAAQNAAPPAGSGFASDQFLADLASEIEGLGIGELAPGFSGTMPGAQPAPMDKAEREPVPSGESGPLKEVFDQFRAELGEMGTDDEDLETHYNLGIAFREMGLLEEAISEFQKVAKATDSGREFRYTMQCCTLLGLAFMEKGQPAIAAIWYERALHTPGNDPESTLALRYDLGVAQESAGEPGAALKSFSQVYAMNIDYRDVAERITALQKPIR